LLKIEIFLDFVRGGGREFESFGKGGVVETGGGESQEVGGGSLG